MLHRLSGPRNMASDNSWWSLDRIDRYNDKRRYHNQVQQRLTRDQTLAGIPEANKSHPQYSPRLAELPEEEEPAFRFGQSRSPLAHGPEATFAAPPAQAYGYGSQSSETTSTRHTLNPFETRSSYSTAPTLNTVSSHGQPNQNKRHVKFSDHPPSYDHPPSPYTRPTLSWSRLQAPNAKNPFSVLGQLNPLHGLYGAQSAGHSNSACLVCKLNKRTCGQKGNNPCELCLKKYPGIAGRICITSRHIKWRETGDCPTRNQNFDDVLESARQSAVGDPYEIILTHPYYISTFEQHAGKLLVQVQNCNNFPSTQDIVLSRNISEEFRDALFNGGLSGRYFLTRLPTVDQMDEWGRSVMMAKATLFPSDVESTLDSCLLRYLILSRSLPHSALQPPMTQAVNLVLRIASLWSFLDYRRPIVLLEDSLGDENNAQLSLIARYQLLFQAVREINKSEKELFRILEERAGKEARVSKKSDISLICGLCSRRLGLLHRRRIKRYNLFPKDAFEAKVSLHLRLYEAASVITHVFFHKEKSIFSTKFKLEHHTAEFGNDAEFKRLFEQYQTADRDNGISKFREAIDIVVETLFFDSRQRLNKSFE